MAEKLGSIYQRKSDMRWVAAITLPSNGTTRRRLVLTDLTEDGVKRKRLEALQNLTENTPTAGMTVAKWLEHWQANIAVKEIRPKTMANYRSFIKNWIIPEIGKVRLDKLTGAHIRQVTDAITAFRKKDGTALSSTTAKTAYAVMSSAFAAAERDQLLKKNPAKLTKAPRTAATSLEVLTVEEAGRLVKMFGDDAERYLWATFMLTGARRGEILGLEWDRVTTELDLSWQLQRHSVNLIAPDDYESRNLVGGLYLTRPKSKAGWRVVPLVEPLEGILRAWRSIAPHNGYGLVFARPDGEPIDPDYASKQWPKILAGAGITKKVRLHDLRHTAVDLLYEAGVSEAVIMEIVGHSTRAMTRGYKSRGNRPQLTDAMKQMSALLASPTTG